MGIKIVEWAPYDYASVYGLPPMPRGSAPIPLIHHYGFDGDAKFQRIGVQSRRLLSTTGGPVAGFSFRASGSSLKIASQDMSVKGPGGRLGLVAIEGSAAGASKLELVNGSGKAVDSIDVEVASATGFKVRFYNLSDGKGRKAISAPAFAPMPPDFSPAAIDLLVERVNAIVGVQTDAVLGLQGQGAIIELSTPDDLGNRIDGDKFNIFKFGNRDNDATYHVVFVWAIMGSHTNGSTKLNTTLLDFSLHVDSRALTLAHEYAHFLSGSGVITVGDHDPAQTDLLFKTAPHGINLRKDRMKKMAGLRPAKP